MLQPVVPIPIEPSGNNPAIDPAVNPELNPALPRENAPVGQINPAVPPRPIPVDNVLAPVESSSIIPPAVNQLDATQVPMILPAMP